MAANLESAMSFVCCTFDKYASRDGKGATLSRAELRSLAEEQFPTLCNNAKKEEILKKVFEMMDSDGDQQVDFKEFCMFLCCLMMMLKQSGC